MSSPGLARGVGAGRLQDCAFVAGAARFVRVAVDQAGGREEDAWAEPAAGHGVVQGEGRRQVVTPRRGGIFERGPGVGEPREMEDPLGSNLSQNAVEACGVEQVCGVEGARRAANPGDGVRTLQRLHEVPADEPGDACDQDSHPQPAPANAD